MGYKINIPAAIAYTGLGMTVIGSQAPIELSRGNYKFAITEALAGVQRNAVVAIVGAIAINAFLGKPATKAKGKAIQF